MDLYFHEKTNPFLIKADKGQINILKERFSNKLEGFVSFVDDEIRFNTNCFVFTGFMVVNIERSPYTQQNIQEMLKELYEMNPDFGPVTWYEDWNEEYALQWTTDLVPDFGHLTATKTVSVDKILECKTRAELEDYLQSCWVITY